MAEEAFMNNVEINAMEDEIQLNPDEILISFSVQDNTTSTPEGLMRVLTFRVQRNMLINSPAFVSDLLSYIFPYGSLDTELVQSISLLANSMSDEQRRLIVCICFDPDNRNVDFALEKVKIEDLEAMEVCVICLEEFSGGSEVNRMPCSHVFHKDCIYQWLEKNKSCPLCRYQMTL